MGVPVDEVVRMLKAAGSERPGVWVGEMEAGLIMRIFSGPDKQEVGRIEFGTPSRIVWTDTPPSGSTA